jgi:hypothetical protein
MCRTNYILNWSMLASRYFTFDFCMPIELVEYKKDEILYLKNSTMSLVRQLVTFL